MLKSSAEQELVDKVKQNYSSMVVDEQSSISVAGPTKYCDITLWYQKKYYHLEAKHANRNNNPNYCKQMIAECLYNRKKHGTNPGEHLYGLLVECDDAFENDILKQAKDNYLREDWEYFGEVFACKAIFLFNIEKSKLYFMGWNDLFSNVSPVEI